jgi:hypothetical protein
MTDLTKITGTQKQQGSSLGFSELIATLTIIVLLVAVQGMFIAKNATTLNVAANAAALGIDTP